MRNRSNEIARVYTPKQKLGHFKKYWRGTLEAKHNNSTPSLQMINTKAITKWSISDGKELFNFPPWLLKKVYSAIDLFIYNGRRYKGRIVYPYIPEEWTVDGHPIIIDVQLEFNPEPPEGATVMSFRAMKDVFIHNKFVD